MRSPSRTRKLNPFASLSLPLCIAAFVAAAAVVVFVGSHITKVADQLADRTGLGEAMAGGVLLGAVTSLPGIGVSFLAGVTEKPDMALGNAIGGIAAQTVFLAVADLFYRRANLEHAAASMQNVTQAALLLVLLTFIGLGQYLPQLTFLGGSLASWLLLLSYFYGLKLMSEIKNNPMWLPEETDETREDVPERESELPSAKKLWASFVPSALALAATGWVLESTTTRLIELTPLEESAAGLFITSTTTSLPELITTVAAVRRGALTLAVGGIVGGNTFDTLFAAVADFGYQKGSLYHHVSDQVSGWIFLTILLTALLLFGLIRRQKYGLARIGVEGVSMIAFYVLGVLTMFD